MCTTAGWPAGQCNSRLALCPTAPPTQKHCKKAPETASPYWCSTLVACKSGGRCGIRWLMVAAHGPNGPIRPLRDVTGRPKAQLPSTQPLSLIFCKDTALLEYYMRPDHLIHQHLNTHPRLRVQVLHKGPHPGKASVAACACSRSCHIQTRIAAGRNRPRLFHMTQIQLASRRYMHITPCRATCRSDTTCCTHEDMRPPQGPCHLRPPPYASPIPRPARMAARPPVLLHHP